MCVCTFEFPSIHHGVSTQQKVEIPDNCFWMKGNDNTQQNLETIRPCKDGFLDLSHTLVVSVY